jgi:hypothetical protein
MLDLHIVMAELHVPLAAVVTHGSQASPGVANMPEVQNSFEQALAQGAEAPRQAQLRSAPVYST